MSKARARIPDCHSDRKHEAFGLCKQCYSVRPDIRERERNRVRRWLSDPVNKQRRRDYVNDPINRHRKNLRRKGITSEQYDAMFAAQGFTCAGCGGIVSGTSRGWHIDHDHACCPTDRACGKCVRGILCSNCNTGLGMAKDSPEILIRWIKYLGKVRNEAT